jgi:predicted nucleic acid-binding protein
VIRSAARYLLDTNIWIRAFRDRAALEALDAFHRIHGPGEYMSSIVAHELRAGVRSPADRRKLERHILDRFARVGRVITPSDASWQRSGDLFATLARQDGLDVARVAKSFGNDVLLALSCREAGVTLVTENRRDFDRIRRVVAFDFVDRLPNVM